MNDIEIVDLIDLLRDLTDNDLCQLDHHGNCQAHGWVRGSRDCPHKRALKLLDELKEIPRRL